MLLTIGLGLLTSAFLLSAILCHAARALARRIRFVDEPAERKTHLQPVALGGGVAFFLASALIIAAGVLFALAHAHGAAPSWLPGVVQAHLPRIADRANLVFCVLLGGAAMLVVGLIDDVRGLSPWSRLTAQTIVAIALAIASRDLRVTAFTRWAPLTYVYTVVWIVGITNAFNLLDNMDGLSAGVAVIASFAFIVVAAMTQQYFMAAMLLVFAGTLLGFLLFNFPPASMFMGDAGSTFIGYNLSVLTILFTFYIPGHGYNPVSALLTPLVILAVPIYDTVSVVAIRLGTGKPIFRGDQNHFSHRLVALGMGRRAAVLTIYLVTLCTALLAPLLLHLEELSILVFANVAVMLALIWVLEHSARRGRNNRQGNNP